MKKTASLKLIARKLIRANPQNRQELNVFKRQLCQEFGIEFPGNVYLLNALKSARSLTSGNQSKLIDLLRVRPVRSLSGIINVSVLTKPFPCPGSCLYCPQETGFPKSYLSGEPAAERAFRLKFDPYSQVASRLQMLAGEGHPIAKIELRIIGGTWSFYPKTYQKSFVAACFAACNNFGKPKIKAGTLEREQKRNETAACRIIGLSVETRPDHIDEKEIIRLRKLGATKVELGIQSIYDDVLEKNRRGHAVAAAVKATRLLKNAGFKVAYQIMLNLYGSTPGKDIEMMKMIFSDERFQPDLLKIYPCAVLPEAPLFTLYQNGAFKPYSDAKLIQVIKEIKKSVPPYVRIERIIRDIPSPRITEGTKTVSNLRQIIARDMEKEHWQCQCVRCREIKEDYDPNEIVYLIRREYQASNGREIFLSFENKQQAKIFSLLRLRIPGKDESALPVLKNCALIREIHTYGFQVNLKEKRAAAQHQGLGKRLIEEAERIAIMEFGCEKIAAISGIGAREYWRKFGFKLADTYMVKNL
jgi:elongator complex protein 3